MSSQKGAISTIVVLTSLVVSLVGIFVGAVSNIDRSGFTRADETTGGCPYHAEAVVVKQDSSTPLLVSENGTTDNYGVANDFNLRKNPGVATGTFGRYDRNNDQIYDYFDDKPIDYSGTDINIISKYVYHNDHLVFAPNEGAGVVDGQIISVTLFGLDDTKWKITGQFCDQLKGSTKGCPTDLDKTSTSNTMVKLRPTCGTNIRYGWTVAPQDGEVVKPTGTEGDKCELDKQGCEPKITKVTYPTENRIHVVWDNPTCAEAKLNQDAVGIEVKDASGDIICSKKVELDASDKETDCKITRDNINNTKSVKKFEDGQTYTATVFTVTDDNSCKSPMSATVSEVYKKVTPTEVPEPTKESSDGDPEPTKSEEEPNPTPISGGGETDENGCRTVEGSGPTRILFLPDQFVTSDGTVLKQEFADYVAKAVTDLRNADFGSPAQNLEIFSQFTFVAYDKFGKNQFACRNDEFAVGCKHSDRNDCRRSKCVHNTLSEKAKKDCSANHIVFISNRRGFYGWTSNSVSAIPVASIDYTAHELGHQVAGLGDEYNIFGRASSNITSTVPNCSSSASCPWDGACLSGCAYSNWKKPTLTSQMNIGPSKTNVFNKPSSDAWRKRLNLNRQNDPIGQNASFLNAFETTASVFNQTLNLKIRQNQRGELSLGTILIENGYPSYLDQDLKEKFFTLKMISKDLKTLYTGQVATHEIHYEEGVGQKEFLREQINLHLPYYDNLASVELYDQTGLKKLDIDLDEYDIVVPTPVKNLCGNNVCDSRVGETPDSCFNDCRPQNDYRNKYKELSSDINKDGTTNTLDCGVCLQEYKKSSTGMKCDIILDSKVNVLDYTTCIDNLGKKSQQSSQPTPTTQNAGPII